MAAAQQNEEFYIGYLAQAPPRLAARTRTLVCALLVISAAIAILLVIGQRPFAASFFDFLQTREFSGVLVMEPTPALVVLRPGATGGLPVYSRYPLVGEGKLGLAAPAAAEQGKMVRLLGKLIYRDDQTMIEAKSGSLHPLESTTMPAAKKFLPGAAKKLGRYTLRGEIVDSKCFWGVMNPGELKTHKACAVRCISGGSPPVFVVRQGDKVLCLLLLSAAGQSVQQEVLPEVARPLEISGEVWQHDNLLTLRADPATYRQLD